MNVKRYPRIRTTGAEDSMPNMELMNWVRYRRPETASLIAQREARIGSIGPRKVMTMPVRRKFT